MGSFPEKTIFSSVQHSLVAYSSLYMVDAPWPFPSYTLACLLLLLMFRRSCWEDFMAVATDITRRRNLSANSLLFCLSQPFLHIFLNGPGP